MANSQRPDHPFAGELKNLERRDTFSVHELRTPATIQKLQQGEVRGFDHPRYGVTEYVSSTDRTQEDFADIKRFFEAAKNILGEYLPESFFVEGEPSDGNNQRSFYVVQKFNDPRFNQTAKGLDELNSKEYSIEFLNKLLEIQEKIYALLESWSDKIPQEWLGANAMDPKSFKEDILFYPQTGKIILTNLFKFNPKTTKKITSSEGKFKPSQNHLEALKMLGLASLVEKIEWAIEKSATIEWVKGKNVHWKLDKKRLESEGKNAMALTFDDGPNEETLKLLEILRKHNVQATFFLVGSLIPGREDIVKAIVNEGHDAAVHEWEHDIPAIANITSKSGLKDYSRRFIGPRKDLGGVKRTTDLITKIGGQRPVLSRVAGVHGTVDSLREFQSQSLSIIHANPYDVIQMPPHPKLTAGKLYKRAVSQNGQAKIRLFHIGNITNEGKEITRADIDTDKGEVYPPEQTLLMMDKYIRESKKQGFEFVKVRDYI